jgi:membrane protease YdiL (CAAX protease family)
MLEVLIVYFVLFFPSFLPNPASSVLITFSITQEISRIFFYNIPSSALVWYLLLKSKDRYAIKHRIRELVSHRAIKNALTAFVLSLAGLLAMGFCVSVLGSLFTSMPFSETPVIESPQEAWLVLAVSCLSTGFLEESFFRYYILRRLKKSDIVWAPLFSSVLFAFCHLYEGFWGVLNAFLAGFLLCFMLRRRHSLAGIICAHGVYNLLVYVAGV